MEYRRWTVYQKVESQLIFTFLAPFAVYILGILASLFQEFNSQISYYRTENPWLGGKLLKLNIVFQVRLLSTRHLISKDICEDDCSNANLSHFDLRSPIKWSQMLLAARITQRSRIFKLLFFHWFISIINVSFYWGKEAPALPLASFI